MNHTAPSSRCHQFFASGHADGRTGQQTDEQQETAPVTTANKASVLFCTLPSKLCALWVDQGLSWPRLWQMSVVRECVSGQLGRGQNDLGHCLPFPQLFPSREQGGRRSWLLLCVVCPQGRLPGDRSLGPVSAGVSQLYTLGPSTCVFYLKKEKKIYSTSSFLANF